VARAVVRAGAKEAVARAGARAAAKEAVAARAPAERGTVGVGSLVAEEWAEEKEVATAAVATVVVRVAEAWAAA